MSVVTSTVSEASASPLLIEEETSSSECKDLASFVNSTDVLGSMASDFADFVDKMDEEVPAGLEDMLKSFNLDLRRFTVTKQLEMDMLFSTIKDKKVRTAYLKKDLSIRKAFEKNRLAKTIDTMSPDDRLRYDELMAKRKDEKAELARIRNIYSGYYLAYKSYEIYCSLLKKKLTVAERLVPVVNIMCLAEAHCSDDLKALTSIDRNTSVYLVHDKETFNIDIGRRIDNLLIAKTKGKDYAVEQWQLLQKLPNIGRLMKLHEQTVATNEQEAKEARKLAKNESKKKKEEKEKAKTRAKEEKKEARKKKKEEKEAKKQQEKEEKKKAKDATKKNRDNDDIDEKQENKKKRKRKHGDGDGENKNKKRKHKHGDDDGENKKKKKLDGEEEKPKKKNKPKKKSQSEKILEAMMPVLAKYKVLLAEENAFKYTHLADIEKKKAAISFLD